MDSMTNDEDKNEDKNKDKDLFEKLVDDIEAMLASIDEEGSHDIQQ